MVDAGADSHGSQFFITLRAQQSLKGKYAAFGRCDAIEVMRRIAAPMVGGMLSATLLTLIVIPALFLLWRSREIESNG